MLPRWVPFALLTNLLWGAWGLQSKLMVSTVSIWTAQVWFTLGLVPLALLCLPGLQTQSSGGAKKLGIAYAGVTGLLGATGNIAYFAALATGGPTAVISAVSCLFPLITVALAVLLLGERVNRWQLAGAGFAVLAIYLLS